jgi:hypothetical protein
MQTRIMRITLVAASSLVLVSCGFATAGYGGYDLPGFLPGVWHGLLAPWSLIARLFLDVKIGVLFSMPFGWFCALIAVAVHFMG